jgi:hypothetical protein
MGIAACCNVRLDSTLRTGSQRRGAEVTSIQRRSPRRVPITDGMAASVGSASWLSLG